ncbi:MAG: radical SAM protein [Deltaproteobacteria bacterium]|nr:radical SAM protein [Deltaproteobacteria bacterium]
MQSKSSEIKGKRNISLSKKGGLSARRVLLTGVFGAFGVDDEFGRKENIMELFHNQVTREQGLASFRFQHRSFGLYFLAGNIDADVTVLDFPSRKRFEQEVKKGYDIVGISFITPNFVKAREMARFVRANCPGTEIILGGHGAAIEGVETLIECDHVCKGEGIRWMRAHLGQDPDAPIVHPALPSAERAMIHGVPVPGIPASLLVPGVGCVNGCKFCCTTHFFGKCYTSYLATGKDLFETACRIADQQGTNEFFVMDENFLKDRARATELMEEMERHQRFFEFQIFSSAEAITAFGLDNLERLGVTYIWIGVESSSEVGNYVKNRGIDPKKLVRDLRDRGIIVLASGILCMEHHTPDNIDIDIDFMVGLEADFVQFMLLTPLPTTGLFEDHRERGSCGRDLPFEEWHGQKHLSWRHPAFPGDLAEEWITAAFRRDYEVNGASMYRVVDTQWRGYRRLAAMTELPPVLEARLKGFEARVRGWVPMLPAIAAHTPFDSERRRARALDAEIGATFRPTVRDRMMRFAVRLFAKTWEMRLRLHGDGLQPTTIRTRYPAGRQIVYSAGTGVRLDEGSTQPQEERRWACQQAAATAAASGGSGTV